MSVRCSHSSSPQGIGIGCWVVVLVPLGVDGLIHRRWESMSVVAAVVLVEIVTVFVPIYLSNAIIARPRLLVGRARRHDVIGDSRIARPRRQVTC